MKPSKFQFINPYLMEVNYKINSDFNADEIELKNSFDIQVKRSDDKNRANVALTLNVNAENENAPFMLKIKVASDFKWEDLDDKTVESMLKFNAPALLLGYMSPIVASITNSSNLPTYNLPFINFKE